MEPKKIYEVAIYLRKSRDDSDGEEDVLLKHETALTDLARQNTWRYVIYREIGSSDSIEFRPEFKRLLSDVENDFYDAVVVIDYDRLSRGDKEDRARIEKILKRSHTVVVTPIRVYDLNDEDQELMTDIEGVFARYEYRMIKKRFQRGKKIGARLGHWTNGPAPFPYVYNADVHSLQVDPAKLQTYRFIKDQILSGETCSAVCAELNRRTVPSPKGARWSDSVLYRLIINEVHLGRVVYGKTNGGLHKKRQTAPFKVIPRENWIIVENAHPAVKTPAEHLQIINLLEGRRVQPKHSRHGTYFLSGLLHCGRCGSSLKFQPKENGRTLVKKCQRPGNDGIICGNPGIELEPVETAVFESMRQYETELLQMPADAEEPVLVSERLLQMKEAELERLREGVNRLQDLFVMGDLSKQDYTTRLERLRTLIVKKENEIYQLRDNLDGCTEPTRALRVQRFEAFKSAWKERIEVKERNRLAKLLIERIDYTRGPDGIDVRVQFR